MTRQIRSAQLDAGGEPPDDQGMQARIEKLETDVAAITMDVALIKATCATKSDLAELDSSLQTRMGRMETSIRSDMASMDTSIRVDMANMESRIRSDMANMESNIRSGMANMESSIRSDMAKMESSLRSEMARLVSETKTSLIMWIIGSVFLAQSLPSLIKLIESHL